MSPTSVENPFTKLNKIDILVQEAISQRQFPGCQILVMKNSQPIFQRSYGFLTYDSIQEVTDRTIYDLASITKVVATTLMIMNLYEDNRLFLDDPISCYLDEFIGSNKAQITIRELLAHNGKLRSYLPFWEQTLKGNFLAPDCPRPLNGEFSEIENKILTDSLNSWIIDSELGRFRGKSSYRYSDIGFMILKQVAESAADQGMESYLLQHFYQPLELKHVMFNPTRKGISYTDLAPTEFDILFRYEQVWGEVHDRNAVIQNGVAGHAGLFSNSTDLAQLMNVFLHPNEYMKYETISEFTKPHFKYNRRGLGWDKPNSKLMDGLAEESFGHKGFTGTMVWADPTEDLVFVFLSNRVYPNAENRKLITSRTRERIQEIVYDAIDTGRRNP